MGLDHGLSDEKEEFVIVWRKFNAIHGYITDHFEAVGEEGRIPLSRDDIKQVLDVLLSVTPENAADVLPVTPGFLFGEQEYTENYFLDISTSIPKLRDIYTNPSDYSGLYYWAWW